MSAALWLDVLVWLIVCACIVLAVALAAYRKRPIVSEYLGLDALDGVGLEPKPLRLATPTVEELEAWYRMEARHDHP